MLSNKYGFIPCKFKELVAEAVTSLHGNLDPSIDFDRLMEFQKEGGQIPSAMLAALLRVELSKQGFAGNLLFVDLPLTAASA